jgi:hypothetical protein
MAPSRTPRTGPKSARSSQLKNVIPVKSNRARGVVGETKLRDYSSVLIVTIAGIGTYSYYLVRELLAALTLFSVAFFFLAFTGLAALLIWTVGVRMAILATPASRSVIVHSRRLIAACTRS